MPRMTKEELRKVIDENPGMNELFEFVKEPEYSLSRLDDPNLSEEDREFCRKIIKNCS